MVNSKYWLPNDASKPIKGFLIINLGTRIHYCLMFYRFGKDMWKVKKLMFLYRILQNQSRKFFR